MLEDQIRKESKNKENILLKANEKDKHNLSKTIFFNKDFAKKAQPIQKKANKNIIFHEKEIPLN
jgi:hypothetical protein